MYYYCTYFDHHYLLRGLALNHSLEQHCPSYKLFILCLDNACYQRLSELSLPNVRLISLPEFEEGDKIYRALKQRLEFEKKKSSGQELLDLLMTLKTASELVNVAVDDLEKTDATLDRLNETRRELDIAINQIDVELEKLPKEDANAHG